MKGLQQQDTTDKERARRTGNYIKTRKTSHSQTTE